LVSGYSLSHLLVMIAFMLPPALVAMFSQPYRVKRVFSFLFPALDPTGMSYQVSTSLQAIRTGGLFGLGLGKGTFKLGLLPEVQSDFIFASVCEEIGFVGSSFFILLFVLFGVLGYLGAQRILEKNRFLSLGAFGLTSMVLFQAVLNLMVVTALLPPTGIPLPFFSQGGTNLFVALVGCSFIYRVLRINAGTVVIKHQEDSSWRYS
ncbi:MAG: cell division protein FtsW, partial [Spirochaetia bacterium]|nr:cell division protein FtsW [Spirochaetia bacterium]